MPRVNPDILRWARETAGLEVAAAAAKLGIRPLKDASVEDRLIALETGVEEPTRPMLLKMARVYRRPLVLFYLAEPPPLADRGTDFRTLPERAEGSEALVDALIRDVHARQSLVRSVLVDEDEGDVLPFVGSVTLDAGVQRAAESIREVLGVDLDEVRRQADPEKAFTLLRQRAEEAGVFVLLIGNLGSHHTALDPDIFRGFAIADDVAPFVVINRNDARSAWSFSLVHELAHVWLGATGVSGGRPDHRIEVFCNRVASEVLLPGDEHRDLAAQAHGDLAELQAAIATFARRRNVSASMVAYRMHQDGLIDERTWRQLDRNYTQLWQEWREEKRVRNRVREGGPDFYVVRRYDLGESLIGLASRMLRSGALSTTKAGHVLGVRPRQVGRLLAT